MNLITDTWRGLVRRKLWPVALLLVGALVAVPVLLAKTPEVEPAPPANAVAAADEGIPATFVTSAADEESGDESTGKRRRTLGGAKDPFEPAPLPKAKKKKKAKKTAKAESSTAKQQSSSGDTKTASGGGATSAPATDPVATATPTATPKPAPANSIRVRFAKVETGSASETVKSQLFRRLEVLPDEANPVVVFQGLEQHGKVARFELTGNVTVEGDGRCEPTPDVCGTLKLHAGETAFITVADTGEETDAQYQLDLVKINK